MVAARTPHFVLRNTLAHMRALIQVLRRRDSRIRERRRQRGARCGKRLTVDGPRPDRDPGRVRRRSAVADDPTEPPTRAGRRMMALSDIRDVTVPRMRAVKYFRGRSDVDFRLPAIVQCTPEAEQALIQDGFGHGVMGWDEAYTSKFIISMDGNGATCSRPAIIMRSRSVIFK